MRVLSPHMRFRATNDNDDNEERFLREKLNVSVLEDPCLRVFIVLRACVCDVHVRFKNQEDKRVITGYYFAKGERVVSSRGARDSLYIFYRTVYLTYQHILQTVYPPFIGTSCLHQFKTVRVRTMIVVH